MDLDIIREDVGQETEKTLAIMSIDQFAMFLGDVSVVKSLIPERDNGLTLEAFFKLVDCEAGKRSIEGYRKDADANERGDSISLDDHAAKRLLDNSLAFNKRGEVVPVFPPKADKKK